MHPLFSHHTLGTLPLGLQQSSLSKFCSICNTSSVLTFHSHQHQPESYQRCVSETHYHWPTLEPAKNEGGVKTHGTIWIVPSLYLVVIHDCVERLYSHGVNVSIQHFGQSLFMLAKSHMTVEKRPGNQSEDCHMQCRCIQTILPLRYKYGQKATVNYHIQLIQVLTLPIYSPYETACQSELLCRCCVLAPNNDSLPNACYIHSFL